MHKSTIQSPASVPQASHASFFTPRRPASPQDHPTTTLWAYLSDDRSRQLPLIAAGQIDCADTAIPVWCIATEHKETQIFQCKFVRYIDMPDEMASAFRDQQVLIGKPFAGAAYVEDFQLYVDLLKRHS